MGEKASKTFSFKNIINLLHLSFHYFLIRPLFKGTNLINLSHLYLKKITISNYYVKAVIFCFLFNLLTMACYYSVMLVLMHFSKSILPFYFLITVIFKL